MTFNEYMREHIQKLIEKDDDVREIADKLPPTELAGWIDYRSDEAWSQALIAKLNAAKTAAEADALTTASLRKGFWAFARKRGYAHTAAVLEFNPPTS